MDRDKIISAISEPSVEPADLFFLKQLTVKFPYTEIFRLVYLRELKKRDEELFQQELPMASVFFTNKKYAYYFINDIKISGLSSFSDYDTTLISSDYFALDSSPQAKDSLRQLAQRLKEARLAKVAQQESQVSDNNPNSRVKQLIAEEKYLEALRLMKKINLNNSEKNVYFAVQIKFLETILNFKE